MGISWEIVVFLATLTVCQALALLSPAAKSILWTLQGVISCSALANLCIHQGCDTSFAFGRTEVHELYWSSLFRHLSSKVIIAHATICILILSSL